MRSAMALLGPPRALCTSSRRNYYLRRSGRGPAAARDGRRRSMPARAADVGGTQHVRQIFPLKGGEQSYIGPVGPLAEPVVAGAPGTAELIADLAACHAYPYGLWVRANMVTSLDGAIALD